MNVAIIGSNGFIGKHLVQKLQTLPGTRLFLFGRSVTGAFSDQWPYRQIDFFNTEALRSDFAGMDMVYYLASETIPSSSWDHPKVEIEKNLTPFIGFLEAVSASHVKKVAFV